MNRHLRDNPENLKKKFIKAIMDKRKMEKAESGFIEYL